MKYRYLLLSLLSVTLLTTLTRCNHELDLTADYKDISFSYAIISKSDSVHYFKIYKGFLTNEDTYAYAAEWENIYFPIDSIEVTLQEYKNGQLTRSAVLDTTTRINKVEGAFANPKQLLYVSDWELDDEATYRLCLRNKRIGTECYAETNIVGDFNVARPNGNWNMNLDQSYSIKFSTAMNATAYDIYMYFHYIEVDNKTGEISHKTIGRRLNPELIRDTHTSGSNRELSYQTTPNTFYAFLSQNIKEDANVTRYIDAIDGMPYYCIQLVLWAANEPYLNYRDIATPSSSIVQNRIEYTNFVSEDNTAYGILASRNHCVKNLKLDNTMNHNEDSLVLGSKTRRLNFDYYRNSPLFLEE